jgi:hypothetical protein
MTIPTEELRTLKSTREYLSELVTKRLKDIKPREVREMAGMLLRHYPFECYLEKMYKYRIDEYERMVRGK